MLSREPMLLPVHSDHMPVPVDVVSLLDKGQVFVPIVPVPGELARTVANRMIYPSSIGRNMLRALRGADYEVLYSHCIDPFAAELLLDGKYEAFFESRATLLAEVIEKYVQERALFGFRDGPDISAMFDDDLMDDDYAE
jgi:hypothetical protein